jgi:hypothetical protein
VVGRTAVLPAKPGIETDAVMNRTRSWWSRRGPGQRIGAFAAAVLAGGLLVGILSRAPESAAQENPGAPDGTRPATEVTHDGGSSSPLPPSGGCDPSYAGCVPLVAEVDCAGAGDGPVYLQAPVRVLRDDHYDLDADHDGIACN